MSDDEAETVQKPDKTRNGRNMEDLGTMRLALLKAKRDKKVC